MRLKQHMSELISDSCTVDEIGGCALLLDSLETAIVAVRMHTKHGAMHLRKSPGLEDYLCDQLIPHFSPTRGDDLVDQRMIGRGAQRLPCRD